MCVKGLPPVLMIHLKRFGFDWEAGRAIKSDDYFEASFVTINSYMDVVLNLEIHHAHFAIFNNNYRVITVCFMYSSHGS